MARFFLKRDIDSHNSDFYFLKGGGIFKKRSCRAIGKRVYPLDRQFYKNEILKNDDCVLIVGESIRYLPKFFDCGEVIIDELFETKTDS